MKNARKVLALILASALIFAALQEVSAFAGDDFILQYTPITYFDNSSEATNNDIAAVSEKVALIANADVLLSSVSFAEPNDGLSLGSITDVYSNSLSRSITINTTLPSIDITLVPGSGSTMLKWRWSSSGYWQSISGGNTTQTYSISPPPFGSSKILEIEVMVSGNIIYIISISIINDIVKQMTYARSFQDPNFRQAVLDLINKDGGNRTNGSTITEIDEQIMASEISLSVSKMNISSVSGIEYFRGLLWLYCDNNQLTTLDISCNAKLLGLWCQNNQLTTLDISQNKMLMWLDCYENYMTYPDSVIGWRELGLTINSPDNLNNGTFRFYNQKMPPRLVSVEDIINVPNEATTKSPLLLNGTVIPVNATNKDIIWSIKDAGTTNATIANGILNTTAAGVAVMTATVKNGLLANAIATFSAGDYHTIALKTDGSLWAWGDNGCGQLGNGTCINSYSPVQIGTDYDWTGVAAGWKHTMAIKTDGSLWSWGDNRHGQLGNVITEFETMPKKVMDNVATVSTGGDYSMAIKTDGSLWAWGKNDFGQLGDGTNIDRNDPVKIMDGIAVVYAGDFHTMAIKTDGSLWGWGNNGNGQLGDGTEVGHNTPIKVMEGVSAVSAGGIYTMAIKTDGSLWAWGSPPNNLGDGITRQSYIPVKIMDGVSAVAAGHQHTVIVKPDRSLWVWGYNHYGQLGDGTNIARFTPTKIMDGVTNVLLGYISTIVQKIDGSLWAWGLNGNGQLGDGTKINSNIPVHVMLPADFTKDFTITVTPALETITVTGVILYQASLTPAKIELINSAGKPIADTHTATDGSYTLSVPIAPSDAPYTLKVTKPGYLSYTINNLTLADLAETGQIDIRQIAGDVNGDGIVNAVDLTYLLSEFNRAPVMHDDADIDGNGIVNAADLTYLLAGFNKRAVVVDK